ncbi:MAG TPA: alpha-amylase family glycosyl hydrolase [Candidatus Saccharimonadales bacterium]|nr:alpha-amylase family glycosyl hydrolase [Candidatus Saccharimonadales bacterium]
MSRSKKDVGVTLQKKGVSFRVWAPFAKSVAVTGTFNNWTETPLNSEGDGYWAGMVEGAAAGQEYKYVISTDSSRLVKNDPRSLQLTTTAGNSVIVDSDFDWSGDNFQPLALAQQVMYELHVGTFSRADPATIGTLKEAEAKLDYLADLGITAIELMPIGGMSMDRGWGYAIDYIFAVESLYGGHRQLLEFVKAAHARGIAVVLDVVYNHFGPDNNLDLWQFDGWSENGKGGIYFYNDWRSKTPWADTRPDYGRPEVRQFILDNVRAWLLDCHLDGLRVDSTIYIRNAEGHNDDPATDIAEGWSLLQDVNKLARKLKPSALMIAEDVGINNYLTKPAGEGGAGFDSQWGVTFPHALRAVLDAINDADRNIGLVLEELSRVFNGNVFQRVVYGDSHDSAANGSARLVEEITPGRPDSIYARQRSLIAAVIILTAPGVPMLLQGQEFMQGGSFNDWQELDWDKAERYAGIITAYKHLIALRKNAHNVSAGLLGQGISVLQADQDNKVIAYHRWDKGGPKDDTVVIVNFASGEYKNYELSFPHDGLWRVRFNSTWKGYSPDFSDATASDITVQNGRASLDLPPSAALILSQDD